MGVMLSSLRPDLKRIVCKMSMFLLYLIHRLATKTYRHIIDKDIFRYKYICISAV